MCAPKFLHACHRLWPHGHRPPPWDARTPNKEICDAELCRRLYSDVAAQHCCDCMRVRGRANLTKRLLTHALSDTFLSRGSRGGGGGDGDELIKWRRAKCCACTSKWSVSLRIIVLGLTGSVHLDNVCLLIY